MKRCHHGGISWLLFAMIVLLPVVSWAEEKWDFSIDAFGGKAFLENANIKIKCQGCAPNFDGRAHAVHRNDSGAWGGRVTGWYLPRKHDWMPQIGLGLDWTRFTADRDGQRTGGSGTVSTPGMQIVGWNLSPQAFSVDIATINLMFRYPLGVTPGLPQGRLSPYVGVGAGVERARLTDGATGFRKVDYAPAFDVIAGLKLFVFRNFALFGEYKRTYAEHRFKFDNLKPLDYQEKHTITANHLLAGVALHF